MITDVDGKCYYNEEDAGFALDEFAHFGHMYADMKKKGRPKDARPYLDSYNSLKKKLIEQITQSRSEEFSIEKDYGRWAKATITEIDLRISELKKRRDALFDKILYKLGLLKK